MAGGEVRVEPTRLVKLAEITLETARTLADAWSAAQGDLSVPGEAFGRLSGGQQVHQAHVACVDAADVGVGRQVAVYESDVDKLYRCAFVYRQQDLDNAQLIGERGSRLE